MHECEFLSLSLHVCVRECRENNVLILQSMKWSEFLPTSYMHPKEIPKILVHFYLHIAYDHCWEKRSEQGSGSSLFCDPSSGLGGDLSGYISCTICFQVQTPSSGIWIYSRQLHLALFLFSPSPCILHSWHDLWDSKRCLGARKVVQW